MEQIVMEIKSQVKHADLIALWKRGERTVAVKDIDDGLRDLLAAEAHILSAGKRRDLTFANDVLGCGQPQPRQGSQRRNERIALNQKVCSIGTIDVHLLE